MREAWKLTLRLQPPVGSKEKEVIVAIDEQFEFIEKPLVASPVTMVEKQRNELELIRCCRALEQKLVDMINDRTGWNGERRR